MGVKKTNTGTIGHSKIVGQIDQLDAVRIDNGSIPLGNPDQVLKEVSGGFRVHSGSRKDNSPNADSEGRERVQLTRIEGRVSATGKASDESIAKLKKIEPSRTITSTTGEDVQDIDSKLRQYKMKTFVSGPNPEDVQASGLFQGQASSPYYNQNRNAVHTRDKLRYTLGQLTNLRTLPYGMKNNPLFNGKDAYANLSVEAPDGVSLTMAKDIGYKDITPRQFKFTITKSSDGYAVKDIQVAGNINHSPEIDPDSLIGKEVYHPIADIAIQGARFVEKVNESLKDADQVRSPFTMNYGLSNKEAKVFASTLLAILQETGATCYESLASTFRNRGYQLDMFSRSGARKATVVEEAFNTRLVGAASTNSFDATAGQNVFTKFTDTKAAQAGSAVNSLGLDENVKKLTDCYKVFTAKSNPYVRAANECEKDIMKTLLVNEDYVNTAISNTCYSVMEQLATSGRDSDPLLIDDAIILSYCYDPNFFIKGGKIKAKYKHPNNTDTYSREYHPLWKGIVDYLNDPSSVVKMASSYGLDKASNGDYVFTIPMVFTTTSVSSWSVLVNNAQEYIALAEKELLNNIFGDHVRYTGISPFSEAEVSTIRVDSKGVPSQITVKNAKYITLGAALDKESELFSWHTQPGSLIIPKQLSDKQKLEWLLPETFTLIEDFDGKGLTDSKRSGVLLPWYANPYNYAMKKDAADNDYAVSSYRNDMESFVSYPYFNWLNCSNKMNIISGILQNPVNLLKYNRILDFTSNSVKSLVLSTSIVEGDSGYAVMVPCKKPSTTAEFFNLNYFLNRVRSNPYDDVILPDGVIMPLLNTTKTTDYSKIKTISSFGNAYDICNRNSHRLTIWHSTGNNGFAINPKLMVLADEGAKTFNVWSTFASARGSNSDTKFTLSGLFDYHTSKNLTYDDSNKNYTVAIPPMSDSSISADGTIVDFANKDAYQLATINDNIKLVAPTRNISTFEDVYLSEVILPYIESPFMASDINKILHFRESYFAQMLPASYSDAVYDYYDMIASQGVECAGYRFSELTLFDTLTDINNNVNHVPATAKGQEDEVIENDHDK